MKHLLIRSDSNDSLEYGMLRDLEDAIMLKTGAEIIKVPPGHMGTFSSKYFAHGTRYAPLRHFIPKRPFLCRADVLWIPLMGPEHFQLDLFKKWDLVAKKKIVYIFDTFPYQYPLINRIVKSYKFDFLVTSFSEAVEPLKKITNREWYCVPQGVDLKRFYPREEDGRKIPSIFISSYGRRMANYHEEIKKWCLAHKRWYDYTVSASYALSVPAQDSYQCYADHMGSSLFTVCWPVENILPKRAGGLSPITCRWFEAAASGAVIIGSPPRDATFEQWFGTEGVCNMPENPKDIPCWLDKLDKHAFELRTKALDRLKEYKTLWSWEKRVEAMLELFK